MLVVLAVLYTIILAAALTVLYYSRSADDRRSE
jgi:hypothetical protein